MLSVARRKYPVKPMLISIDMEKTGAHLKDVIQESGYSMRDIMKITGITAEQTIYKWYRGKSIPALETQIILCRLFDIRLTDLLILEGDPEESVHDMK